MHKYINFSVKRKKDEPKAKMQVKRASEILLMSFNTTPFSFVHIKDMLLELKLIFNISAKLASLSNYKCIDR